MLMRMAVDAEAEQVARLLGMAVGARRVYGAVHERAAGSAARFRVALKGHLGTPADGVEILHHARDGSIAVGGRRIEADGPLTQIATSLARHGCGGLVLYGDVDAPAIDELLAWLTTPDAARPPARHGLRILDPADAAAAAELAGAMGELELPRRLRLEAATEVDRAMQAARLGRGLDFAALSSLTLRVAEEVFDSGTRILGPVLLSEQCTGNRESQHAADVFLIATSLLRTFAHDPAGLATMGLAALLHDIGKSRIPRAILDKEGPLTKQELRVVRRHPVLGAEILAEQAEVHPLAIEVAYCHHMRADGRGYPVPNGPLEPGPVTDVVQVVDMFEALTAQRPYRSPLSVADAIRVIETTRGMTGRGAAIRLLRERLTAAPAGSQVRLATGERGIVLSTYEHAPARPVVRIFTDERGTPLETSFVADLAAGAAPGREVADVLLRPGRAALAG